MIPAFFRYGVASLALVGLLACESSELTSDAHEAEAPGQSASAKEKETPPVDEATVDDPGNGTAGDETVFTQAEEDAFARAISALAGQRSIPESEIEPFSVLAQEWPDSSLGCPKPGSQYLQVITPGYRVRLMAGGKMYHVHVADRSVVICDDAPLGRPKAAPQHLSASRLADAEQRAAADLASRLNVPATDIRPAGRRLQEWPDTSLGCPEPGQSYAQVQTRGFVLSLEHDGRTYTYHTDLDRLFPCPRIEAD
jgi:hypothetical protein